jgi:CHRD domain-containing protein
LIKATTRGIVALLALVSVLAVASPAAAVEQADTVVFQIPLSGADPQGEGVAVLRFDQTSGELCYEIIVRGIGEPTEPQPGLGSAHIHLRATGGIAVDLEAEFVQAGEADVFFASNCVQVDRPRFRLSWPTLRPPTSTSTRWSFRAGRSRARSDS